VKLRLRVARWWGQGGGRVSPVILRECPDVVSASLTIPVRVLPPYVLQHKHCNVVMRAFLPTCEPKPTVHILRNAFLLLACT